MTKRTSRPKRTVKVGPSSKANKKPKGRRGCVRYLWLLLLSCLGTLVLLVLFPSPPPTHQRNVTQTVEDVLTSDRAVAAHIASPTPMPTDVPTVVVQQLSPTATTNLTSKADAIQQATATERAMSNAVVLTQLASAATPSPTVTQTLRPSPAPPTQAPAETWYITARANARSCPQLDCSVVTVLDAGTRVDVVGVEHGASVSGNDVWRLVMAGGQITYVHSSLLSQTAPRPTSAPAPVQQTNPQQSQPISTAPPAPPPMIAPAFSCNCSKTCGQMTCEEAYFQLNQCGCSRRDGDHDGVPCENVCSGG